MWNSDPPEHFCQGDIFEDVPIISIPDNLPELKRSAKKLEVNVLHTDICIISQTCDIQHRRFVHICPVRPVDEFLDYKREVIKKTRTAGLEKQIRKIRDSLISWSLDHYIYCHYLLPYKEDERDYYVDFSLINSIPLNFLQKYTRIVSMIERHQHLLGYRLLNFFHRIPKDI